MSKFLVCTLGGTVPANPPATKFAGDTPTFTFTTITSNLVVTTSAEQGGREDGDFGAEACGELPQAHARRLPGDGARGVRRRGTLDERPGGAEGVSVAVQFVNVAAGETSGYQVLGSTLVALAMEDGEAADGDEALRVA